MKSKRIKLALLMLFVVVFGSAKAQNEHWTWNSHAYPNNSTFVGIITIEGVEQRSEQLEIGAFYNDECRGSIICLYNANKDRYYACLTVNGEAGMEMTFRLWNHATDEELNVTPLITYTFQPNDFFGTTSNPFVFPFTLNFGGPVYTGGTSTTWSDSENWRDEEPPTSVEDEVFVLNNCLLDMNATVAAITIIEGQTLTVESGSILTVTGDLNNTTASGIVIQDGGQIVNATENVFATMEKNVFSYNRDGLGGWYTIASPMNEMPIEGSSFLTESYDLYRFNEMNTNQNEWENYKTGHADFTTFENGRGYLYANTNTFSPVFTGVLNTTDITRPLTYTERTDGMSGFNLIGNPFPHVIYKGEGGAIDNTNLASGYYTLTNEGAWHVHTYDDAIQPGQGILVKTIVATDLTIHKTNAAATAEMGNAKTHSARLELTVSGLRGDDKAFAYFAPGIGLDKMDNLDEEAPSLSIRNAGEDYAIAHLGAEAESVDVMFYNRHNGDFTLSVGGDSQFSYLHLIDHLTGSDINLLEQPSYTFHANGNEYAARFMLVFRHNTGIDDQLTAQHFCFVKDGVLYLNEEAESAQLTMTDMLGRTVKSVNLAGNTCLVADLPSGVYLVRLDDKTKSLVQKVVINH